MANAPPIRAPRISSGKKMPPGAPDPKLTAEKRNLTTNVRRTSVRTISPSVRETIRLLPLPRTDGIRSPSTPAARNAITSLEVSFKNFGFL